MDTSGARLVAGRYRLLVPLGSGGMGTVWRARDEVLGREVAVKELTFPPGLSDAEREVLRERTRREARAAARLDHPSAVTVYDVVEDGGAPYLVLELVEARTLSEVVKADGPLPPERAAQVGLDLLGALDAAHARGILHRDVKPSNVLVRDDGRVVLTDFGIASTTGDPSITSTGLLLGSPAYIAPERARGEAPGPASDLWSLGATLFTAVEGRPPFDGGEPLLTVTAVVTGEHAPFAAAGPLEPVLDGLLDKDPATRLDAAATRRLLAGVAQSRAPRTQVMTAAEPQPQADRTTALHLGDVRRDVAAAEAAPAPVAAPLPLARPAPRPAAPARSRTPVLAGAVGAALLAAAVGAYALSTGDEPSGTTAAGSPRATAAPDDAASPAAGSDTDTGSEAEPTPPAAEPTSSGTDDDEEPAGAAGVPDGWTTDTGGAGWTVALPPGYRQTRAGEYVGPNRRTLRVETGPGRPDAVADRRAQAESFEERHPTYEEIRIEAVDYRGYEAADWEFTYEGLHVLNRVFVVDGTGHSLFFQTRARDFAEAESQFREMIAAFRPAGG